MSEYANRVAQTCYDFYKKKIPSKWRPSATEWTILASILSETSDSNFKVLCLATGTKCLSEKELSVDGTSIHDSHAEILVRRCFIRYILNEIIRLQAEPESFKSEIIEYAESITSNGHKNFSVRPGVKFILFISHTPCK